jgi:hypothetical protein
VVRHSIKPFPTPFHGSVPEPTGAGDLTCQHLEKFLLKSSAKLQLRDSAGLAPASPLCHPIRGKDTLVIFNCGSIVCILFDYVNAGFAGMFQEVYKKLHIWEKCIRDDGQRKTILYVLCHDFDGEWGNSTMMDAHTVFCKLVGL